MVDRDNSFDLIRLFAALQVFQFHAVLIMPEPPLLRAILAAFPGVAIFFVISGFVVTWSYMYGEGGVSGFYLRRALRIYPGLWTAMIVILGALAVSDSIALGSLLRFLKWICVTFSFGSEIYGNNIVGPIIDLDGFYKVFPAGTTWTIPIEVAFYILAPLIMASAIRKRGLTGLSIFLWMLASVVTLAAYQMMKEANATQLSTKILSQLPLTYLWQFMIGAFCAVYWQRLKSLFEKRFLTWLAAYVALSVLDAALFNVRTLDTGSFSALLVPRMMLLAGAVISFAFTYRKAGKFLRENDFSYGMYLYHFLVFYTLLYLGAPRSYWLWPVAITATFGLAAASWFLVEKRALRLKRLSVDKLRAQILSSPPEHGKMPPAPPEVQM